jgi:hypothetical protein
MSHDLQFVDDVEQAISTWREARDEVARRSRIDAQIADERVHYQQRTRYQMPAPIEREIRADLQAQEVTRATTAEAEASAAYAAALTVLATVRAAHERLPRPPALDLSVAQTWLAQGSLAALVEKYLTTPDSDPLVYAIEEAVALEVPKFRGEGGTREDAETALRLRQAVKKRAKARWPAWTAEAESRLAKAMNVNDSALLTLKRMHVIS